MTKKKTDPEFSGEALDALIAQTESPADVEALFRRMKKALIERALGAELSHHLGYAPGEDKPDGQANHRNGSTPKTVLTDDGAVPLDIPR
ncbi:MAG TPA: transposase, partial [Gemmatimonadaceae bacterium]